jgi:trigger factor
VDALVEKASLEYPAVLLEREIDHILDDQAGLDPRDPRAVDLYLQRLGKSEAEVRESVREEAERRLRRSLVLSEFAEAENITVEESEVDEELQKMAASAGEQSNVILQLFSQGGSGHESLHRSLHTRKTLGRLVEITSGEPGPDAATETAASARPSKRRRTEPRQAEPEETSASTDNQETE